MDTKSLAQPAHPIVPEETREAGTCSGCGTTTKTLTAPRPNVGHGYEGPMCCLSCNFASSPWTTMALPGENGEPIVLGHPTLKKVF